MKQYFCTVLDYKDWHRMICEQPMWMSTAAPALLDTLCVCVVWGVSGHKAAKTGEHPTPDIRHQGRVCAKSNFISAGKHVIEVCQNGWLTSHHVLFIIKQITGLFFFHYIRPNQYENIIQNLENTTSIWIIFILYLPSASSSHKCKD